MGKPDSAFAAETASRRVPGATITAMKVALGSDHAGFELKEKIRQKLTSEGVEVNDCGTNSPASCDYPDYARAVGEVVASRTADLGILVCGTGIGMSIAANKVRGIRAAHVSSEVEAELAREHNDANVLALGSRVMSEDLAFRLVDRFLETKFLGGRHERRVKKIAELEHLEAHHMHA